MISGGGYPQSVKAIRRAQNDAVKAGRIYLCKEKPGGHISPCTTALRGSIVKATKGLSVNQLKFWRTYIYNPAVLLVKTYCAKRGPFKTCVRNLLRGGTIVHYRGVSKLYLGTYNQMKYFYWKKYLLAGAKLIKKAVKK